MGKELSLNLKENIERNIPLKRFGEPEEINELIYFLLEKNTYITGANIPINGGLF